ncbi:hypothetical protein VV869_23675 [Photobacterium sp. MCCC 1A19761]|uniref:hypothetical protein n=1 Tax=Photobacterium sp. MCCC 1A19761 TaxID=3115000 RepID=UPI00307ECA1D
MKTDQFWEMVKQMSDMTMNSCRVIRVQQDVEGDRFELERLQILKARCDLHIQTVEKRIELALSRGNDLKPGCEFSCEEKSLTTPKNLRKNPEKS